MLRTTSAAGLVSSLIGESATAQTEMHTNEAPKHVPHANVKSSQRINDKERPTHIGSHSSLLYAAFSARRAEEELYIQGFSVVAREPKRP